MLAVLVAAVGVTSSAVVFTRVGEDCDPVAAADCGMTVDPISATVATTPGAGLVGLDGIDGLPAVADAALVLGVVTLGCDTVAVAGATAATFAGDCTTACDTAVAGVGDVSDFGATTGAGEIAGATAVAGFGVWTVFGAAVVSLVAVPFGVVASDFGFGVFRFSAVVPFGVVGVGAWVLESATAGPSVLVDVFFGVVAGDGDAVAPFVPSVVSA